MIVSADMTEKMKPEPDSIRLALDQLKVKPEESILIGDSLSRDIPAGRALGMVTAYAKYGDRNPRECREHEVDYVLLHIKELMKILDLFILINQNNDRNISY